jgi:hypothetical protein
MSFRPKPSKNCKNLNNFFIIGFRGKITIDMNLEVIPKYFKNDFINLKVKLRSL